MTTFELLVREPGQAERYVTVDGTLDAGREVEGLLLADAQTSRRHLRFTVDGDVLSVTDLGSTNGTTVNGTRIERPTPVADGDTIEVGDTVIVVASHREAVAPEHGNSEPAPPPPPPPTPAARPPAASPLPPPPPPSPPPHSGRTTPGCVTTTATADAGRRAAARAAPPPVAAAAESPAAQKPPPPRPVLDEMASRANDAAVIRFLPGTAGEQAAAGVARAAKQARRHLAGVGSEPWGAQPTICLVDPFPDPDQPGVVMTSGTIVDGARNEIWMVVTAESPPEPLERPLALCFGAALPAGAELGPLLEGYGLFVADTPDPDPELRQMDLPPFGVAEGELGSAMALSFVRFLVDRAGRAEFLQFLSSAQPGRLDAAAQHIYGTGAAALEEAWRTKLHAGAPDIRTGQFLRLATRYLRPHVRREVEMFVYLLFGLAFTVVFPFAFKQLLDKAIPSGHFSQVVDILAVLLAAFIVSLLAGLRGAYLSAYVSASVVRQLRREMFVKMQTLPQAWYSQRQQGDVLSRLFSDVGMLEQGLSQTLRGGLSQILSLVVSAIVLVILNPLLAVITLVGAPIIGAVYKSMAKGAQKRSVAVQEETGSVLTVASENYGAQPVVKAFGLQGRETGRFTQASDRLFDRQVKLQLYGGVFGLSVNMIVTLLRVFILGLGAWLILHGHLTIGGLVAFMSLMGEVLSPVTVLTGIGQQVQASTGALTRINEVLDAAPEVDEDAGLPELGPIRRDIVLRDVGFSYTPERRTLEGINIAITAGQKVAFVGPTGAGKSSVLQLLMRFYDPDEGTILFDGKDCTAGDHRLVAGPARRRVPGDLPLQRHRPRQHRAGEAGCKRRRDRGGGAGGRDARLRHLAAARLRHLGRRARRPALRWTEAAALHRPRPPARPERAAARRGDLGARPAHRAPDRRHARARGRGTDHHRRDPPPHLHHGLRQDLRDRGRPARGTGHP